MNDLIKKLSLLVTVFCMLTLGSIPAMADTLLKLWTGAPGSTHYTILTTMANAAQAAHPDLRFEVSAGKPATRTTLAVAKGDVQFCFMVPDITAWLKEGKRMFKPVKNHAKLASNLRAAFMYRGGYMQFVAYADSGIKSFSDLRGKKLFIGPKRAALNNIFRRMLQSATGMKAGVDYKTVALDWRSGQQAFQDNQVDFTMTSDLLPSATIQQFTIGNKIRIIGVSDDDFAKPDVKKLFTSYSRSEEFIPADIYGKNQANRAPTRTIGFWAGVGVNKNVPDEVVYKVVKAFWENIGSMRQAVAWASAIKREDVFTGLDVPLHPGAARYYREVGMNPPM